MPYDELDKRKDLHLKLLAETHAALKIQACHLKMSMQLIMNELAILVTEDDKYIMQKLREIAKRRKNREAAALASTDADSLLNHIEEMRNANNDIT